MFTGLIQNLGEVVRHEIAEDHSILVVRVAKFLRLFELGESIAVNGVCLTAVAAKLDTFTAEISPETLSRTNLKNLKPGDRVNIEFPLTPSTALGGHFVQGHVDGIGEILTIENLHEYHRVLISYPRALAAFFIEKGSVAVDGVSLTVNKLLDPAKFEVMIIPHTWSATTFQNYQVGSLVNLEVDMLAKYIQRAMDLRKASHENVQHP